MKANYTIKNFAKRVVMVLVASMITGQTWGAWTLCTSTSDFVADDYYMFVCYMNSTYYYIKAPNTNVAQGNYSTEGDYVTSTATPTSLSLGDAGWQLKAGESSGQWKLKSYNSNNYLYTGSGNNKVGAAGTGTATSYWTVAKNASENTFRWVYNYQNRVLSGYASSPYGFRSYDASGSSGIQYLQVYRWTASCSTNPTVTAGSNSSVTSSSARVTCASGISSLGSAGCSITSYGFVLNTTGSPTISDTKHQVGTTYTTTGTLFYKDLTGLSASTTYYVRPYATNGNGTAYGTQTSFTTSAATYTVTIARNNTSWGTVSQASVTSVTSGTSISADGNVLTVGATNVTATATAADANYTYAFSSWSGIPAGGTVTGNVTVTANFTRTERSLTNYRTLCCNELAAPANPNETPSNDGGTLYWDAVTDATGYEVNIDGGGWVSTGNGTTCNYTVTGKACGGTSVSWQVRATGDGTTNCAAGAATTVRNFSTSSCSCTGTYSFHYQHSGAWNAENICFSPVAGATNNYLTDELSLPYAENYKVAWQGVDQSYTSSTGFNGNMPFFHNRDKKFGANPQSGNLGGGKGKFHVYHDSGSTNKYVSFIPTGYTLNFGTGDTWTNDSTKTFTGKTNAWDETEWYTDLITLKDGTIGKKIFVGLQTASGYVWCDPYSQKDNLSGLRTKSGSGESWVTGGLTTSYPNKTGKFRLYANSGDKNWYVTFVPHFQLKYNANGGTGTMSPLPATPVSCEETSGNRTVTVATSSFTAPTGKVFDHWNTAADNSGSNVSTGSYTLTGDVTLYAIWRDADYTVTLNQSPSVGATLTGATNTAHYGGTINISASEPTGYQFVNWTSSPSVTFADATSASTSFTMPASNVTITANYVQVYTVTFVHHDKGTFSGGSTEILVPTSSNTITLPTVTSVSCGFYDTFEGWIASGSEYSESTSKPATVYAGGSSYTVTGDVTLRALYSKCDGDGGQVYRKIASTGEVTNGTYILVANTATPRVYSGYGGSAYGSSVDGLTADGDDFSSTLPSDAKQITVTVGTGGNAGKFAMYNANREKYLTYTSGNSLNESNDIVYIWKLTDGSNVNSKACPASVLCPDGFATRVLQCNPSSSNRFACYENSQSYYVFLYKLIDKCTKYYATNPSCVKPTGVHITYNANAGDATMSCSTSNRTYKVVDAVNQYPKLASAYTFCDNATRPGYTLVGWNTQANGLGTTYELDHSYSNLPVSGDLDGDNYVTLTVYAMWAPAVSFNLGNATGGTGVPAVVEADGGFMLPTPTAAQIGTIPCEYSFYGWSESSVVAKTTKPTLFMPETKYTGAARTLYAVYRLAGEGGNPDLFSLSYTYSATKYYVAKPTDITTAPSTWGSDKVKKFSATTDPEEALAFGTKSIGGKTVKSFYWMYDEEEVYVYWKDNAGSLTHANEEDTDYGWTISGTTDLTFSMTYPGETARQIVFTAPSYGDPATFNASTSAATSLHKEEASTTSYTYATNPSCETTATLAFVTNGGTLNYPTAYDASSYVDLTVGTSVYLPTATYAGEWTFEGWMKGSEVTSTDMRPESANFIEVTLNTTTYSAAPAGTTTFYAVYSKTVNDKQFDPVNGGTYKLFAIMSDGTTKKYMPVWGGTQTTLTPATVCAATGDYTITPGTGEHAGQYQITHGSYTLGVRSDGDTQFKDVSDAWWNIEPSTSGKGTYRITIVGSSNRCMSYGGTGFFGNYTRNDVSNPSQSGYRDIEIGECIYTEYTSTPENIPYITITGSPVKITSTNGERVYAPTKIHIEAHNFSTTRTIHFSATNGFATNPASVNTAANGAYSGDIDIYYQPTTDGDGSIVSSVLTASQSNGPAAEHVSQTFSAIRGRNLPQDFVIAVKSGEQWYALPDDCHSSGTPKAVPIDVNDPDAPTAASLVPHNVEWRLSDVVNSGDRPKDKVYFYEPNSTNNYALYAGSAPSIQTNAQVSNISGENSYRYEWGLTTSDLCAYTISNANVSRNISINSAGNFGTHAASIVSSTLYLLPITAYYEPAAMQVLEWKANSVVVMYTGTQTAATTTVGDNSASSAQTLASQKLTHGIYELTTGQALTDNAGQTLKVSFGGSAEIAFVTIPIIINSDVTADADHASEDVIIVSGGKLTAAATKYSFHNIYVYGGGKLKIASGSQLGVNNIILRAGGVTTNGSGGSATYAYTYPQLELGGTLTSTQANIKYEYITDYDHWYQFCLPFNGTLSSITYPQEYYGDNVTAANTGSWVIKRYAGEVRATGNYDAWKDIETEGETSVIAGHGYIFWGAPKKVSVGDAAKQRQQWGIQRITMPITAAAATTAETDDKNISVDSYSEQATSDKPNDQGWNLIGNPYMVNMTGLSSTSMIAGELVHSATVPWDGKWVNNGDGVRYVTIPDNHFDSYEAKTTSVAAGAGDFMPGRAFFVQIAEGASTLTFAAENRASLIAARFAQTAQSVDIETGIVMSDESKHDEVNFWIKDGKTEAYEYNADYPKTPNNNNFNLYGVHSHGDLSWIAISPEIAEGSMAIGYQVPKGGEYMLSLSETYVSDKIEHMFVTDHAMNPEVTVDLMDGSYEFTVNQAETNNERFTVSIKMKDENQIPTTIDPADVSDQQSGVLKFLYHDKMYILRNGVIYDATGKKVKTINK